MVADPAATANGTRAATPDDMASGRGHLALRPASHLSSSGTGSAFGSGSSLQPQRSRVDVQEAGTWQAPFLHEAPGEGREHPPSSARIPPDPADEVAGWFDPVEDGPSGTDLDDWPDHFGAARLGVP
jgi:hypothetical protein